MKCANCKTEIESDAKFCHICRSKVDSSNTTGKVSVIEKNEALFYSQNWERTRIMTFSQLPRFDILITEQFLYLIALPTSLAHDVGGIFGIVGSVVASFAEKKAGNKTRSSWLDSNQQLTSREYEKISPLKIPIENLKDSLLFKKSFRQRMAIFTYGDQKITLQGNKNEYERFKTYVGK